MNAQWLNIFLDAVLETAVIVAVGGAFLAIAIALLLILLPDSYRAISQRLNTWISTRQSLKAMEIPRKQERRFYHHHRLFGLLVAVGAIYTLSYFMLEYDPGRIQQTLLQHMRIKPLLLDWLLDAGSLILMLSNLFVLIIGAIVFTRPSLLKGFEAWCNKWVSTRNASRFLDQNHKGLDRFTVQNPRIMGMFLLVGSVYVLGMLGIYLI